MSILDEQCPVCGFLTMGAEHNCHGPKPDGLTSFKKAIEYLRQDAIEYLKLDAQGRERALAITKLDEAEMWFIRGWFRIKRDR